MVKHKIADVKVHLVSEEVKGKFADATRNVESVGFLIVRITTDQGLEGIGVTYHEVGGEATRDIIVNNMKNNLIGRDPFDTEVIWNEMVQYLRGVGRKGVMFCALSAVDIALWDLKGKITGQPLYKLFGGGDTHLPVYGSGGWTSYTDEELVDEALEMVARGYKMIKLKVGVEKGQNYLRDVERIRKVRDAVGPDIGLMLDANNCWDAATGIRFANSVRELNIMFLEEPVMADDMPGLARYRTMTDLPLATGEHEYTKYGARDLIIHQAADIIQMDTTRAGGFTEMLKIGAMTQAWNLKFAPHAMENISAHLVAAFPNAMFLERLLLFEDLTAHVYVNAPLPKDGYMDIPDLPGLGLVLNEDYIRDRDEA